MERLYELNKEVHLTFFDKVLRKLNKINVFHIFCISVFIRFLMAVAIQAPEIIDELAYKTMAKSFFDTGDFHTYASWYGELYIPNFLYSFLISGSFFFKENFYIVIKLINSILVSATVFPLNGILKSFDISDQRRKICLILVVALPFHLLSSYAMPESLYSLLIVVYMFFINDYIVHKRFESLLFVAFTVIGLLLTKPHGIAIFLSMIITIIGFKLFEYRLIIKRKTILEGAAAIIIIIATILLIYKGVPSTGGYGKVIEKPEGFQIYDMKQWLLLILGHIEVVLFFFFIPVVCFIKAFIVSMIKGDEHIGKLILAVGLAFIATFSMVMIFSNSIAVTEFYQRLHARYYYSFYSLFLLVFICTFDNVKFSRKENLFIALGACIVGIGFIKYIPLYLNGLNSSDNLDLTVYTFHPQLIIPIGCLFILVCVSYFLPLFAEKIKFRVYVSFLMIVFLIGNAGQFSFQTATANAFKEYKDYSELINIKMNDSQALVYQIGSGNADQLVVNFFSHLNYVGNFTTSEDDVKREMQTKGVSIPTNADFVISLKGPIAIENYNMIENEGKCTIYQIKQEILINKLPVTEINKESKIGLYCIDVTEKTSNGTVKIVGWALDANQDKTAGDVFIKCGDKIYSGDYGLARPDVDNAFHGNGNLVNSGFNIEIPLEKLLEVNFSYTLIIPSHDKTYKYESVVIANPL